MKNQTVPFPQPRPCSRFLTTLLCGIMATLILAGCFPAETHAASKEKIWKGFTYKIEKGKAVIMGYSGGNRTDDREVVVVPGVIEKKPVVHVELYGVGGASLDLNSCTKLKKLHLEQVYFGQIHLSKTAKLQSLEIHESGQTSSLDLSGCKSLKKAYLDISALQNLSAGASTKLKDLFVFNTKMRTLDLEKCTGLRAIVVEGTALETINLGKKKSLKTLKLSSNRLKSLNISECKAVKELNFSYNAGLSVHIAKNRRLKTLTYSPQGNNGTHKTILNPLKTFPKTLRYTNM